MGLMSDHGLIVDVGMHRGEDTKFYLAKGFRVLAIEASPELAAEGVRRFRRHIEDGRLEVLNIAVADEPGEIEFFISERDGWGSTRADWAEARGTLGISSRGITVPADTLANILANRERPHFVKIDVEGADAACVRSLAHAQKPRFLSVECDPIDRAETMTMLQQLEKYGYTRFKLLNQAKNPALRCPRPSLEGDYVDATFTHYASGPFGEETPGDWVSADEVRQRYLRIAKQQTVRARYTATGRVFGLPVGRFHRLLESAYNAKPVKSVRESYAELTSREIGGWFDLHAAR